MHVIEKKIDLYLSKVEKEVRARQKIKENEPFLKLEKAKFVYNENSLPLKEQARLAGEEVVCGCRQHLSHHNHDYFSLLDGIASPELMVDFAAFRGFGGMSLTSHGTMAGVLRAGGQGKNYKTGRFFSTGRLFSFQEKINLVDYIKKYKIVDGEWDKKAEGKKAQFKIIKKYLLIKEKISEKEFDDSLEQAINKSLLEELKKKEEKAKKDESEQIELIELSDTEKDLITEKTISSFYKKKSDDFKITHNTEDPYFFRVINENEFEKVGDFAVLAGNELYISWRKNKDKKYHHITVCATGAKGYRALVLLTSIGSIPSRLFTGGRGFFRPRVFVEDLELAIKEAEGELLVTTGCPISIVNEALLRKTEEGEKEAREFLEWGKRVLPKNRFFAEIHLCDISLDFNRMYSKVEDKYYSKILGTPVSRLRLSSKQDAFDYAKKFYTQLRRYIIGETFVYPEATSSYDDYNPYAEKISNPWSEIGIHLYREKILDRLDVLDQEIKKNHRKYYEQAKLSFAATIKQWESGGDVFNLKKEEDMDNCKVENETEQKISPKKELYDRVEEYIKYDNFNIGKNTNTLEENEFYRLMLALKILDKEKNQTSLDECSKLIARFILNIYSEITQYEDCDFLKPNDVVHNLMGIPKAMNLCSKEDADALITLSQERDLFFEEVLNGQGAQHDELFQKAARALLSLFEKDYSIETSGSLAPFSDTEESIVKEWVMHPEGNRQEHAVKRLVALSKEYDIPLIIGTDAHMPTVNFMEVQDALMKRGKKYAWHMSRPYSVPRAGFKGLIEDLGIDWTAEHMPYVTSIGNCAYKMIEDGCISLEDITEAFGTGALILGDSKCVSKLDWDIEVPKIKYDTHKYYHQAKDLLETGKMKKIFFDDNFSTNKFTEKNILNIESALITYSFLKAIQDKIIPGTKEYYERFYSEMWVCQEASETSKLCDFFLVQEHGIVRFRDRGVSVGPGRGSSGSFLLAMITGITYGDPIKKDFMQDRWMSVGRLRAKTAADIDVDVNDRQIAGYEFTSIAKDSFLVEIKEKPLTELEKILFAELFFSSEPVTHEMAIGYLTENTDEVQKEVKANKVKSIKEAFSKNLSLNEELEELDKEDKEIDSDDVALITPEDNEFTIWGAPVFRVGTYTSLKAKAAVKEAIRIADQTPFEKCPPIIDAPAQWVRDNKERKNLAGKTEEEISYIYEDELLGHLSHADRWSRRRVKLADRITKEMTANAGLLRIYTSEIDLFEGAVYGKVPSYWDMSFKPPQGSPSVQEYFKDQPMVEKLVRDMLNIYKAAGVHAGGMCIGREAFSRIPVRIDKSGYVSQYEMKYIEKCGVLKFDLLGLSTLTQVSETLKMILDEVPYEELSWWVPKDIYDRVKAGESTDYLWRFIPKSLPQMVEAMVKKRSMTFQIDTSVFGRELDKLDIDKIVEIIKKAGDPNDPNNDKLVDILNAFLALFRPGPMALHSHINYLNRLCGKPWELEDPWLAPFTGDTFGLIVYQEQVMKIYGAATGCSGEETDDVRRAMGKKDAKALEKIKAKDKFVTGLLSQGVTQEKAELIWKTIFAFAEYGFNSPHSYHYGIVSAVTLFLKSMYTQYFFRVTMGLAKPADAAKFLSEIKDQTRPPCVIRSDDIYWNVLNNEYFPGLSSIESLKRKDIDRIIKARNNKDLEERKKTTIQQFFSSIGGVTKSLASLLSKSGSLRYFGSTDQIANGYLAFIQEGKKRNIEEINIVEESVDFLSDFNIEVISEDLTKESDEKDDLFDDKIKLDFNGVKVPAKEMEILKILKNDGVQYQEKTIGNKDQSSTVKNKMPTVKSSTNIVVSNKTKGAWCHWIVKSLAREEAVKKEKGDIAIRKPMLVLLEDLKNKKTARGTDLTEGMYRTVAIPQSVSTNNKMIFDRSTGQMKEIKETKVVWLADGIIFSTKFSRHWSDAKLEETIKQLYDAKMYLPLLVTVARNEYIKKDTKEKISYYTIEDIQKLEQ